MKDNHNRTIDYMRISVTDRCNLRCTYCMPSAGVPSITHGEILRLEEILRLCHVFVRLGVDKFKVTGGEPLVRGGVVDFIGELKRLPGVKKVTLTTNGLLLDKNLSTLVDAGIDGINISLDTLNPSVFKALTGSDGHEKVMSAINSGFRPIKINCVPIAGVNDTELTDIAGMANKVSAVRFIELMPVGLAAKYEYISSDKVKTLLESVYGPLIPCTETLGNGPAQYYSLRGFSGCIGIISAMSHGFCGDCNRMRLTSDGRLKLCLAHDAGISLKEPLRDGASDDDLAEIISLAVAHKPRMHNFGDQPADITMNRIGG